MITPESKVKKDIKQYLDLNHWFHFPVIQNFKKAQGMRGISDRIACKRGIVLFIEIKSKGGDLSPSQRFFKHNIIVSHCHYIDVDCVEDLIKYIEAIM